VFPAPGEKEIQTMSLRILKRANFLMMTTWTLLLLLSFLLPTSFFSSFLLHVLNSFKMVILLFVVAIVV
jgi:hypothetical protein